MRHRIGGPKWNSNRINRTRATYAYLYDTLGSALLRLDGAVRYSIGDPALDNALRHIKGSALQVRAALAVTPPIRTQPDQKEAKS